MDKSHKLDAPDNEELSRIDQVGDHSNLTTIYKRAKDEWTGELVSDEERERRRQKKHESISFGIRKQFLLIGFLIPLPIILMTIAASAALAFVTEKNASLIVIPAIFLFLLWAMATIFIYKKVFAVFYSNALQAGPFIFILLVLLGISIPLIHIVTAGIHAQNIFNAALVVGGIEILLSIALSLPLLIVWTTPKLSGNAKVGLIFALGLVLIGLNVFVITS